MGLASPTGPGWGPSTTQPSWVPTSKARSLTGPGAGMPPLSRTPVGKDRNTTPCGHSQLPVLPTEVMAESHMGLESQEGGQGLARGRKQQGHSGRPPA